MIELFSDTVRKVFQFLVPVVSSNLGTTEPREHLEMASFFADAYPELCRAHTTGTDRDFRKLIQKVQPSLQSYAGKLATVRPLGAIGLDDYVQEAIIIIWRNLPRFRYICPFCAERLAQSTNYIEHCKVNHGETLEPVKTLEQYLNYSIKQYMRNHLRSMGRAERMSEWFIPTGNTIGSYTEELAGKRPDLMVFSQLAIERLEYLVNRETNPKVRMLVAGCLKGVERPVIWRTMAAAGLAKTPKSAAVCVNRLMKRREVWRGYRSALA